jgi:hypothetical protein
LDFVNVTEGDAAMIGTRLALSHGVSDAMAMLEPELSALVRTVTAGAAMLQMISRLGEGLNAFNGNAAPIVASSPIPYSPEMPMEQGGSEKAEPTRSAAMIRANVQYTTTSPEKSDRVALQRPRETHIFGGNPPSPRPPSTQRSSMIAPGASPPTKAATAPTPRVMIAMATSSPVELPTSGSSSIVASPINTRIAEARRSRSPNDDMSAATVLPAPTTGEIGPQRDTRVEQFMLGAVAPGRISQLAADLPAWHPVTDKTAPQAAARSDRGRVTTVTPAYTTADAAVASELPKSAPAPSERQQTESEPRQGTLVLDSAQLGRWMIDHLERHASRPAAMTTGIDPRMNATYPGAPTGA